MKKYKIIINNSIKKSSKDLLFERMSIANDDFRFPLTEQEDKNRYKNRLNKSHKNNDVYNRLVEHFSLHNKLNGNLKKDSNFLYEFSILLEEEDFDPLAHLQQSKIDIEDLINEKEDCVLTFAKDNSKINTVNLSLPQAYTCPFAGICKSLVKRSGGRFASSKAVRDVGGGMRCFGASGDMVKPNERNMKWRNYDLILEFEGDFDGMVNLIEKSLNYHKQINGSFDKFRMTTTGDFFSQEYFNAWVEVAKRNPDILFYTFTTSIPYWVERLGDIPENMILTASRDETKPDLAKMIDDNGLKYRVMVDTMEDAAKLKLPVDVNDKLASSKEPNVFALLIHGTQPKETGKTSQARKNSALLKQINKTIKRT